MLGNFDQAKRDLADVRNQLMRNRGDDGAKNDVDFLKLRALDLMQDIYVDSKLALAHIKDRFTDSTVEEVLLIVDRALRVTPPLRRSLSEEDGKTVQSLVDAAIWKSRFVWLFSWVAGALIVITLAALGYTVLDLNKQADKAREAITQARENAQDAISKMNNYVKDIEKSTSEIESQKKAIDENVKALEKRLGDPGDEIKRITTQFNAELIRLSELEQDWVRRRELIGEQLGNHVTFLAGEEGKVNSKMADFNLLVSQRTAAIEPLAKSAADLKSRMDLIAETFKNNADEFSRRMSSTEAQLKTANEFVTSIGTTTQKLTTAQQQSEQLQAKVKSSSDELEKTIPTLQKTTDGYSNSINKTKEEFDDHAKKQQSDLDLAINTARTAAATTSEAARQTAEETIKSLNSSQNSATGYVDTIRQVYDGALEQSKSTALALTASGKLQTDIADKLQTIDREEKRLQEERGKAKQELDEIRNIITVVEDKRADILDKLHTMLDQKPSFDFAAVWKTILANYVLMALSVLIAVMLLILTFVLYLLASQRQHQAR